MHTSKANTASKLFCSSTSFAVHNGKTQALSLRRGKVLKYWKTSRTLNKKKYEYLLSDTNHKQAITNSGYVYIFEYQKAFKFLP